MSDNRRRVSVEVLVAVVISLAALATSWASYEASLWNGAQALHYGRASGLRTKATRDALDASVTRAVEVGLFSAWLEAAQSGNSGLANFYAARFPASLKPAFEEWIAQTPMTNASAAPSPFALKSYQPAGLIASKAKEDMADAEFAAGQRANRISNAFMRAVAIFATAMFFGAVGQVFASRSLRIVMAAFAFAACAVGIFVLSTLPIRTLG